jgi:HD-like signal output (HDOD) protein
LDKLKQEGSILDAERDIIHHTHADIGFWLAEKWNLPDTILDSVLYHHAPSLAARNEKHAAIVHIADYIAAKNNFGPFEIDPGYLLDQNSFDILSITENDLKNMEETISPSSAVRAKNSTK